MSAARPRAAIAGFGLRQYTAELAAQIGIQAVIVDPLQSVQRRVVHAGGPEGQPGFHCRAIDLAGVEVAFDDHLQVRPRAVVPNAWRRSVTLSIKTFIKYRMVAAIRPFLS
jgi:hypothetical protein